MAMIRARERRLSERCRIAHRSLNTQDVELADAVIDQSLHLFVATECDSSVRRLLVYAWSIT